MKNQDSKKGLFLVSLAIHAILLVLFPILLANFRKAKDPEAIEISFYRADDRPVPPPKPVEPTPVVPETQPEPVAVRPEPPEPVREPVPQPKPEPVPDPAPRIVRREPAPKPAPTPAPEPPPKPAAPRPVRTNVFAQERAEPEQPKPATRQTRSAGFGEAPAPEAGSSPPPTRRASARLGGFEVAPESTDAAPASEKRVRVVTDTTFGGETAAAAAPDLRTRDRQPVRATGFTIEAIAEDVPARTGGTASVNTGGFGDTVAVNDVPRERKRPAANPDTPVEILVKPRPVYTPEARALQVEGEIVLRVVFVATGEMRVLGVVQGLGHGLDEAAVNAAKKIEFKPARRDGQPVDYAAVLRIVFQLA